MISLGADLLAYFYAKRPIFFWHRDLDCFICNLSQEHYAPHLKPLDSPDGRWSQIDLVLDSSRSKIIVGFNTQHSFPASEVISRLYQLSKTDTLTLGFCVSAMDQIFRSYESYRGFGDYLSFFRDHSYKNISLSVYEEEKKAVVPLTKELFIKNGGKLLS